MARPRRLVLLGHPVARSLSPTIHNAALSAAAIDAHYDALDVDPSRFDEVIAQLRAERVFGNVTVPFKERVHDACDELSDLARRVGAVNTFWFDDSGRMFGDNTDVGGFDAAVHNLIGSPKSDLSVGVIGAGGAAAAVLAAVEQWRGATVHVFNRTPERARVLCERFGFGAQPVDDVGVVAGAQLVINATSIGLKDDSMPLDPAMVRPDAAVLDLVYRPGETPFVRALRARGINAADGIGMLVEQAALAFERWFNTPADRSVMWSALDAH
jgi:shikimate dehydrogenase